MERTAPTDSTDTPESTDSTAVRRLHPRRTVLRGVAAAGGVGVLAACSGGSDDTGSGGSSDSGSDSGGGETSAAPAGTELGPASEVQVAGGKIYEEQKVVVTQPTQGAYKAFSAVCTHQGCLVSEIVENAIVCKCHNSEFSIEDGSVITGPASTALAEQPVTVANDVVTLG